MRQGFYCLVAILLTAAVQAKPNHPDFDEKTNALLTAHYQHYAKMEYFSGIALSVYKPGHVTKNYYIGQVSHDKHSPNMNGDTLFEIGSITKSFTAAMVLQLENEKKIHLSDTLKMRLPHYSKWSHLTLKSLLNMTSGLPNYSDSPLMNTQQFLYPEKEWTNTDLIKLVYPPDNFNPPLRSGYAYTNTGYLMAAMMIEQVDQQSFADAINTRLIKPTQLHNTFYSLPALDADVKKRLAHGYGYNPYANPELVGHDMTPFNLSWAGAAGALISNAPDVIAWVNALFVENKLLNTQQKQQLMQAVSTRTGKPIKQVSANDPTGFGLGVIQRYDKNIGRFWFYEGETEGFRALYMYVPSNGIIIASLFNSAVNSENDHAGKLMMQVYQHTVGNLA